MVGETVGSYRIIKQLGAGAMGEVYLAEHRHLKRQAALKLLARELVDRPDLLERFFLEARATSAIAHPGIVQIFDCEVDPTGRPYIVMELLTGDTLAALLARQGALPPLVVARLGRSLADALDAAHAKGIVHRDLKPENMFVLTGPSNSADAVKVVDFGIAKLAGELQVGQVHKTRSGVVMGTPIYMSPEQCRDSAAIDFRTDIYSLGCVLHEMLTGRPPFSRDNFGDLMVAHLTEPPPDPRALVPSVPAPLAELTMELLRKDPAQRPASMRVIAERLMTYVARMTTVPGAAASASVAPSPVMGGAPPPRAVRTTFGAAASEVAGDDAVARPSRRTPMLIAAVVLVAGAAAAGAALFKRTPETAAAPTATAPPATAPPPTPAAAPIAAAPAPSPKAPPEAKATAVPPPDEKTPLASGKPSKKSARHAGTGPEAPAAVAAAPATPPAPAPVELPGTWEGPWTDHAHGQQGRFFLQLAPNGSVAGWMTNTSAKQSYRMAGSFSPAGALELTCQCPPGQAFVARGSVHADAEGELKGEVALTAPTGVFGQSRLTLRRSTAAR